MSSCWRVDKNDSVQALSRAQPTRPMGLGDSELAAGRSEVAGVVLGSFVGVEDHAFNVGQRCALPGSPRRLLDPTDHRTFEDITLHLQLGAALTQQNPGKTTPTSIAGPPTQIINLTGRVKRTGFGFRRFAHYRTPALLYAGKPMRVRIEVGSIGGDGSQTLAPPVVVAFQLSASPPMPAR